MEPFLEFLESISADEGTRKKLEEMIKDENSLLILTRDDINSELNKLKFAQRKELWEFIQEEKNRIKNVLQIEYTPGDIIRRERKGSSVFFCKRKTDNKRFAAKRLQQGVYRNAQKEIDMVTRIDQDNKVVHFYGYCSSKDSHTIIMQLCGGDVGQLIRCKKNKENIHPIDQESGCFLPIPFLDHFDIGIGDILLQVVAGVKYLHTYKPNPIVHRDIKPSNFLLYKLNSGKTIMKIADFGLSRLAHSDNSALLTEAAGTSWFMAPEYLKDNQVKPTTAADIFSLGLTLFYIFTEGTHVYGETENHTNCSQDNKLGFNEALPREGHGIGTRMKGFSDEQRITFCDMIRRMLKREPRERFNIHDVDAHPTFWDSKKKSDFYWDIYKALESRDEEEIEAMRLDLYDKKLETEDDSGDNELSITEENIPEACRKNKKHPIKFDDEKRVVSLLKIMRNKKSHGDLTSEENEVLGIAVEIRENDDEGTEDGKVVAINWNKFLDAFTGKVPQLLVHLYEKFRKVEIPDKTIYYHCPEANE